MAVTRTPIGVTTSVSIQSAPTSQTVPSGRAQFIGITERGPLNHNATIRSIDEYTRLFGGRTGFETLYDSVRTFFQEGGGECFITRVVGAAATNGSVTLADGAEGSPKDVVTVEFVDPGQHSAGYVATVTPDGSGFDLTVTEKATGRVLAALMGAESPADLANMAIGNPQVIVKDLGAGVAPKAGVYPLSAGSDDRASITVTDYVKAADAHKAVPAGVGVAAPGMLATVAATQLGQHADEHGKIFATALSATATVDEAVAVGESLLNSPSGRSVGVFYPHIRIPDTTARTRVISPEAYVLAARSVTHRTVSPAKAPAGIDSKILWVTSPVRPLDDDDVNILDRAGINAIHTTGGTAYLDNWRSLSADPSLSKLNDTDALNQITIAIKQGMRALIWRPNEGRDRIRGEAEAIVASVMYDYVTKGFVYPTTDNEGNEINPGYTVNVENINDSGQNSPYDQLRVEVAVKLSPTIRHIVVPIRSVDLRATL